MEIPFSQACENNKVPILKCLEEFILDKNGVLLEIGHGTGQHAEFLSESLQVQWQPSDIAENNWMMEARLKENPTRLINSPKSLEVGEIHLKNQIDGQYNFIFTANTLHIMSEELAYKFCEEVPEILNENGLLFIYGPFKFNGEFTTESNAKFDIWLKNRDPLSGIRDFEKLNDILENKKMVFTKKYDLPANNHLLVYRKI